MTVGAIEDNDHPPATLDDVGIEKGKLDYKLIRICCWCVALVIGAAEAWATRFTMNPDGVSYLDVGDAYFHGDWQNAINAYWSPLYSWILGLFLRVLKPSAYWEYPLVHVVNFLIYVATLVCFEFFLKTFIADRNRRDQLPLRDGRMGLPESSWWLLGYSLFLSSSLILIGLRPVTPDMCIAAFIYLASALMLKICANVATRKMYVALGVVLGFAYLAKAVMFPLGFVFLITALFAGGISKNSARNTAIATLVFLAMCSPFILAVSHAKTRLSFGDSGRINYQVCVLGDNWFIPNSRSLKHPVTKLSKSPSMYEFQKPIAGTYPLWYDPSYWHEGAETRFDLRRQLAAIFDGLQRYRIVCLSAVFQLNVSLALLILIVLSFSSHFMRRIARIWVLWVPALTALLLYMLVVVELRYIGPFVLVLWIVAFSGIEIPAGNKFHERTSAVLLVLIVTVAFLCLSRCNSGAQKIESYFNALASMQQLGLRAGDTLIVIGAEPAGPDAAFLARLGRMRIVAEVSRPEEFWAADASTRARLAAEGAKLGAKAILTYKPSRPEKGWEKMADTEYYVYILPAEEGMGSSQMKTSLQGV